MPDLQTVDLRCEDHPRRLLGRLLRDRAERRVDPASNLLEFSCRDCARDLRARGENALRVLHRFDLSGALVETEVVR